MSAELSELQVHRQAAFELTLFLASLDLFEINEEGGAEAAWNNIIDAVKRLAETRVDDVARKALRTINDAANDARHRGEYKLANALVHARIKLARSLTPPVPTIRSMVAIRGEVLNGEDALQARIAELQEQLATREEQ